MDSSGVFGISRGNKGGDSDSGNSDPYVKVCCTDRNNGRVIPLNKTSIKKKTLNPIYNETFNVELTDDHAGYITLEVYDYDTVGDDDIMGCCVVSLTDLIQAGNGGGNTSSSDAVDAVEREDDILPCTGCSTAKGKIKYSINFTRTPTPRIEEFYGGVLSIKVIEAVDLIALDKGMFDSGLSDPFVKIQGYKKTNSSAIHHGGKSRTKVEILGETKVMKKTLNPVWNERLKCTFLNSFTQTCTIALYDYDRMSGSDPMGIVNINLNDYRDCEDNVDKWYDIIPCKGCKNPTGKIHVNFLWAAEISPEDKLRLAEEAKRKLFDKPKELIKEFSVEEAMASADDMLKNLNELKDGMYLRREIGDDVIKEWRNEESELEKALDMYDDVKEHFDDVHRIERNAMKLKEERLLYLNADERRISDGCNDGFDDSSDHENESDDDERPSTAGSGNGDPNALKILFSPDKIIGDPFKKLKGNEKTELARRASRLGSLVIPGSTSGKGRSGSMLMAASGGKNSERRITSVPSLGGTGKNLLAAFGRGGGGGGGGGERENSLLSAISQKKAEEDAAEEKAEKERSELAAAAKANSRMASIMIKGGGGVTGKGAGALAMFVGGGSNNSTAKAALGSEIFAKKKFDASKFMGAAMGAVGGAGGSPDKPKTPTVAVSRMVTTKQLQSSNDSHFTDPKQEYERMVKGLELRLRKKGRGMTTVRTVEKVVPKNANHALNILNAAARDEPIKYLAEDLAAAYKRHEQDTNIYASHFTKFKPLFSHPLPTSRPRFDAERMMKKLNNMPRNQRVAAAAAWGLAWCIEELYMQGCPVSVANNTGYTPLHIAARFDFVDCVQVILNIGMEPSALVEINAETKSYLTPLRVAICSNAVNSARLLASLGGLEKIERPKEGYRTILDIDGVTKFPWLPAMGTQPEDYTLKRPVRAMDDQAKNLGGYWENLR
jgi:hypothetical protein